MILFIFSLRVYCFGLQGVGDWDECVAQLSDLVARSGANDECEISSCYLGQVIAPNVSLSDVELYGFSECWFSTEDVLSLGGQYNYTLLSTKARDFCKLRWSTIQVCFICRIVAYCVELIVRDCALLRRLMLSQRESFELFSPRLPSARIHPIHALSYLPFLSRRLQYHTTHIFIEFVGAFECVCIVV